MATTRKVREIPWGDLAHVPDERSLEPWEQAMAAEELAARLARVGIARRGHPPCPVLIGFTPTWSAEVVSYEPGSGAPCPGCGSVTTERVCAVTLRAGEVCVVCSVSRAGPIQWPMQASLRRRLKRFRGLRGGLGGAA